MQLLQFQGLFYYSCQLTVTLSLTTEALKGNQAMISVIQQTCTFLTLNKLSEKGQLTHWWK